MNNLRSIVIGLISIFFTEQNLYCSVNIYTYADTSPANFVSIMFWNVENYFDSFDDPKTKDEEFTPFGDRHWTYNKFIKKRDAIAKTIISVWDGALPVIVGMAEVENRFVLEQLVGATPLAKAGYKIVHRDSPDGRGIDVSLIYLKDRFRVLRTDYYRLEFENRGETTRLILYVKGVLDLLDTLHLFVNHWPSKLGGELKSFPKRRVAAQRLRMACDSVFNENPNANIILMGDFNDTPESPVFKAFGDFINITEYISEKGGGSIKFGGKWELIDQFFVSQNLMNKNEPIFCDAKEVFVLKSKFLLENDKDFIGTKPKRVYKGPQYNGGISDHLPIFLKIFK